MNNFSKELQVAVKAAKVASVILLKYFNSEKDGNVSKKGKIERVSDADLEAETEIRKILTAAFPDYDISGEEFGESNNQSEYKWYIDPLCGSNGFIRGLTAFGISIALTHKDKLILGVCSLPAFDKLYWAEKDKGAFCNGKKIHVSNVDTIEEAFFTTNVSVKFENIKPAVDTISKIAGYNMLIPGAFPYTACNLAQGVFDAHIEVNVRPVHRLAGTMIVLEAGGKWTKVDGTDATIFDNNIVLSNGVLHDSVIKMLDSK